MRMIEVTFPDGIDTKSLLSACMKAEPMDYRLEPADERGRRMLRLVFRTGDGQDAIDSIQGILANFYEEAKKLKGLVLSVNPSQQVEAIAPWSVCPGGMRRPAMIQAASSVVTATTP